MKKAFSVLAACALLALFARAANAGAYAGSVVATRQVNVLAPCDGTLARIGLTQGGTVEEGGAVAVYETQRVYATADGTVAAVWAKAGGDHDGAAMELEPVGKYTVYATTDGAYESPDTLAVRAGETVHIKCTADGSHRGTGKITGIDGDEYTVVTAGGEFFVGETVYLYRGADFASTQRIGVGTLLYSDNAVYESGGTVVALHVQRGDRVERGQLLYETLGTDDPAVASPASGIVASVFPNAGASAEEPSSGAAEEAATPDGAPSASGGASADAFAGLGASAPSSGTNGSAASSGTDGSAASSESGAGGASAGESEAAAGGNAVSKGDVLAVIYPYGTLMVRIMVPEAERSALAVGASVGVVFADDPETTCAGTVQEVGGIAEDGEYAALILVDRASLFLGMTCDVFTQ